MIDHYWIKPTVTLYQDNKKIDTIYPLSYTSLLNDKELKTMNGTIHININSLEDLQQLTKLNKNIFEKVTSSYWGKEYGHLYCKGSDFTRVPLANTTIEIQYTIEKSRYYSLRRLFETEDNQKVLAFIKNELDKIKQMEDIESIMYIIDRTV